MESQTESTNGSGESNGHLVANCREWLCSAMERFRCTFVGFTGELAKIARDDPRRVVYSLKVGLALTLVSVLYYIRAPFDGWGSSTIWAVITVVFVMEFTVGIHICVWTYGRALYSLRSLIYNVFHANCTKNIIY